MKYPRGHPPTPSSDSMLGERAIVEVGGEYIQGMIGATRLGKPASFPLRVCSRRPSAACASSHEPIMHWLMGHKDTTARIRPVFAGALVSRTKFSMPSGQCRRVRQPLPSAPATASDTGLRMGTGQTILVPRPARQPPHAQHKPATSASHAHDKFIH